jgi:NAD(P)-dependent dehydrogenase (short-subunit alcohol dehydrogenase family)
MRQSGGGSIIFTSSFVGHTGGLPGMAAYGASKAGLIGLTQCLAAEHGPEGIRVNALLPGGIKTPMSKSFGDDPETLAAIAAIHALKRMGDPLEIAKAALFLASDASSFVTGSALLAEGGSSIGKF